MDRRLAVIAGAILAGAGALGMTGRRRDRPEEGDAATEAVTPETGTQPAQDAMATADGSDAAPAEVERPAPDAPGSRRAPQGAGSPATTSHGNAPVDMAAAISRHTKVSGLATIPFLYGTAVAKPAEPEQARPLADVLMEVVQGYPIDPGRMVDLRCRLAEMGAAIDDGRLAEGTAMVDFDWMAGPGIMMNMVVSVLATREYARINFADVQGNLRAPELDVYIRGSQTRIVPDATVRTMDVEDRRSEATVTRAKLRAMSSGIQVHPGDAAGVLRRCRITGTPFTG